MTAVPKFLYTIPLRLVSGVVNTVSSITSGSSSTLPSNLGISSTSSSSSSSSSRPRTPERQPLNRSSSSVSLPATLIESRAHTPTATAKTYHDDSILTPHSPIKIALDKPLPLQNLKISDLSTAPYSTKMDQISRLRNMSFLSSLICMLCGGTVYGWSSYGNQIAEKLGYSSTQTALIAGCGGWGLYLSGPFVGHIVDKYGPHKTLSYSCLSLFIGYLFMALTYNQTLPNSSFLMCVYFFLVGIGSSGTYTSAMTTNIRNFPKRQHGFAVGVAVAAFGLSAFVFSALGKFFYVPISNDTSTAASNHYHLDTSRYLLFMAIVTGGFNYAASKGLFDLTEYRHVFDEKRSPLTMDDSRGSEASVANPHHNPFSKRTIDAKALSTSSNCSPYALPILFSRLEGWMFFLSFFFASGAGLMYFNNIGTIILSLAGPDHITNLPTLQAYHVSLLSIFNSLSRIVTGVVSDKVINHPSFHNRMTRLHFFSFGVFLTLVCQWMTVYSLSSLSDLVNITILIGISYGVLFSTAPAIISEWFGAESFGINWGWMTWAPAIGGQMFNMIFGHYYDSHVHPIPDNGATNTAPSQTPLSDLHRRGQCVAGTECFMDAFDLTAFFTLIGTTLAVLLIFRLQAGVSVKHG